MDNYPVLWRMSTLRSRRHIRLLPHELPHDLYAALYRSRVETVIVVETTHLSILSRTISTCIFQTLFMTINRLHQKDELRASCQRRQGWLPCGWRGPVSPTTPFSTRVTRQCFGRHKMGGIVSSFAFFLVSWQTVLLDRRKAGIV